ncbi:hypothetical protein CT0861_07526 [Colletotrichum tofieldiae]|uniref:Ubiquitin-like domain-containing protein n=1 Tax=Colletotrichum tofieldiae TaxID=708197 RepID=A0A166VVD5_9PEZI|nr:hypothetical protein CT0861_07526 [Colletotrichum tofieldiae]
MEFALTCGAVGDFIAVIALIKDIVSALDGCRGSVKGYRDILQSLGVLQRTVEQAAEVYSDSKLLDGLDDLTALALRNLEQIRHCLESFHDTTRKFGPSLAGGGSGNVLRDVARKIQWKLEEKDVDKLRAEVMGATVSLSILLDVTNMRILQRNHEAAINQASATENRTAVAMRESNQTLKQYFGTIGRQILSKLNFVAGLGIDLQKATAQLLSMMIAISGELGGIRTVLMRLERPLNDEHFILEDATGRVFPIHFKTITSWEAFEFIIADRFKGKKGANRIRRKRYLLQERATQREVIRSTDWESAFLPYQRVDMSLLCTESQKVDQRAFSSCPFCKTISPGETGVQVQW